MMLTPNKEFWEVFKKTEGALSCAEALAIMNVAVDVPSGDPKLYIELGSYHGKSAMSAIYALPTGAFKMVDPIYEDQDLSELVLRSVASIINGKNFSTATVNGYSTDIIPLKDTYWYVFIDSGSHSDDLPMREVKMLEDRMVEGGIIAFHDYLNQFVRVKEAYDYLVGTGKYESIHIDWQPIFDYVNEHNLEDGNSSWHQYPDLGHPPNFVGAVKRIK